MRGAFHFDGARSSLYHDGLVRHSIHKLKFGENLYQARPLSQLLIKTFLEWEPAPVDVLVPVPLHIRRLKQRGFNQTVLLARFLSKAIAVPMNLSILKRQAWSVPQTRLSREERLQNVREAFVVRRPELVAGKCILLVDDVFTTGSTLSECARVIKESGAEQVLALSVSRALPEYRMDDPASDPVGYSTSGGRQPSPSGRFG